MHKSLEKWKELAKTAPFDFQEYYSDQAVDIFVVEDKEIGRYVGQFHNNKRHGVG